MDIDENQPVATVEQLIALLQKFPPSSEVIFRDEEISLHSSNGDTICQISEHGYLVPRIIES